MNNSTKPSTSKLLGHARHQLRNPINAIIGYSEIWLEDLDPCTEKTLYTLFKRIALNGKIMLGIINELLTPEKVLEEDPHWSYKLTEKISRALEKPLHKVLEACEKTILKNQDTQDLLSDLKKIQSSAQDLLELSKNPFCLDHFLVKAVDPQKNTSEKSTKKSPPPLLREEGSILVVDDNGINCELLSRQCQRLGYSVTTAMEAQRASELLEEQPFDLILLDIVMPGMSGLDLLKKIRRRHTFTDLPIIMVTGKDDSDDIVLALEMGANDYITKPFSLPVVTARVKTQLLIKKMVTALERANQRLEALSFLDGLTGIANRRRFDNHLLEEWRRTLRRGYSLSLIMIDIDHFKLFNDTYGHDIGDIVLKEVAHVLRKLARRSGELVARYGGEEFSVILPNSDAQEAILVAEMMRKEVSLLKIAEANEAHVTISAGVCSMIPNLDSSPNTLSSGADNMLYQAKKNGRNRVESIDLDEISKMT